MFILSRILVYVNKFFLYFLCFFYKFFDFDNSFVRIPKTVDIRSPIRKILRCAVGI